MCGVFAEGLGVWSSGLAFYRLTVDWLGYCCPLTHKSSANALSDRCVLTHHLGEDQVFVNFYGLTKVSYAVFSFLKLRVYTGNISFI